MIKKFAAVAFIWGAGTFASVHARDAADLEPYSRWRGVNVSSVALNPKLVERLAGFGCNSVRVNLIEDKGDEASSAAGGGILGPYTHGLARLDESLPLLRKFHLQTILSLSGVPGRTLDVFWTQASDGQGSREKIPATWKALAQRYKDEPAIIAYDIFNEPTYKPNDADSWWKETLPASIAVIREINPSVWLVVEPGPWGEPAGFAKMPLVDDSRVIYSFHHYLPHAYTHQGVRHILNPASADTRGTLSYPGNSPSYDNGKDIQYWNKEALEKSMRPVVDFQKRHPGARIYIGEFGVARWASGAAQWLQDSIDLFEKHGWDWSFHSFGGWSGWDPTYPADAPANSVPGGGTANTDCLKVVVKALSLNRAPTKSDGPVK